jgi:hypothetical protein
MFETSKYVWPGLEPDSLPLIAEQDFEQEVEQDAEQDAVLEAVHVADQAAEKADEEDIEDDIEAEPERSRPAVSMSGRATGKGYTFAIVKLKTIGVNADTVLIHLLNCILLRIVIISCTLLRIINISCILLMKSI